MIIKPEMINEEITKYDLLPLSFLKKSAYTGSKGKLRYKIEREVIPLETDNEQNAGGEQVGVTVGDKTVKPVQEKIVMRVFTWTVDTAFDETPPEEMTVRDFEFTGEALKEVIGYLNEMRVS